jgi:Protein of unknown function (DUF3095)
LRPQAFPFVFGGDGASFAVGPDAADQAREALAATAAWVRDELDLELRVALVPVSSVRERGFDVRVARFAPSPDLSYAMFSGGGLSWATEAMKKGEFAIPPGPAGARPDLTGLSCRWEEIRTTHGVTLSLVLVPFAATEPPRFRALVKEILQAIDATPEVARPLRNESLALRWPPTGLDLEVRARRKAGASLLLGRCNLVVRTLLAYAVFRLGLRVGDFDPTTYRAELIENSDFRKYDDGLRMTLDCTPALADRIEALLADAEEAGIARCGTYRQEAALMTCFVPSPTRSDHVHFVDGASGGYAAAARAIKIAG